MVVSGTQIREREVSSNREIALLRPWLTQRRQQNLWKEQLKKLIPSFLFVLPLFLASDAFGQQESFKIDPQASQVAFPLGDILHTVKGTFHVQSGAVDFDRSVPKMSHCTVKTHFKVPYVQWGLKDPTMRKLSSWDSFRRQCLWPLLP